MSDVLFGCVFRYSDWDECVGGSRGHALWQGLWVMFCLFVFSGIATEMSVWEGVVVTPSDKAYEWWFCLFVFSGIATEMSVWGRESWSRPLTRPMSDVLFGCVFRYSDWDECVGGSRGHSLWQGLWVMFCLVVFSGIATEMSVWEGVVVTPSDKAYEWCFVWLCFQV